MGGKKHPESLEESVRTSVSMAKSGFQLSGGIILHSPYLLASGAILLINSIGFLNSSSDGRYVGASCKPCGRSFLSSSGACVLSPRRSTWPRFSGADLRALRGIGGGFSCPWAGLGVFMVAILPLGACDGPVPFMVGVCAAPWWDKGGLAVVKVEIEGPPPVEGGTTMASRGSAAAQSTSDRLPSTAVMAALGVEEREQRAGRLSRRAGLRHSLGRTAARDEQRARRRGAQGGCSLLAGVNSSRRGGGRKSGRRSR